MIEEMQYSREEEINIVLIGSVFVKGRNPFLLDTLKEKISAYHRGFNFKYTLLDVPPVAGGVIWALNTLESSVINSGGNYYDKILAQLRDKI